MKNLKSEINELEKELELFHGLLNDYTGEKYGPELDQNLDDEYYEITSLIRDIEDIDIFGYTDEEWIEEAESLIQQAEDLV